MREKLEWGRASYSILDKGNAVLDLRHVACFAEFMTRFSQPYDTIRIYDIDCKPTIEYKDFYLQYVIEMLDLEGSFNEEYFEFKSLGVKMKDALVMTVVRFLWETLGGGVYDTPNLFFKKLRDDECPYDDKLSRFCHFYKGIDPEKKTYFSEGHSWKPHLTVVKTTNQFKKHTDWNSVNGFFSRI